MSKIIQSWAALAKSEPLHSYRFEPGPLSAEEVEIAVEYCGLCHSDISIIENDWGLSTYPVIPGHEVIGRIVAMGDQVRGHGVGDLVGLGWNADSCMHCHQCQSGNHNVCAEAVPTIVGHAGGFADRVRCDWRWAIAIPESLDPAKAGPLLCGGMAVYGPFAAYGVRPTDRVGVVGIGGLGHLGLQLANAWGCEVTAFTSSAGKADEARTFGAHHVVPTRDAASLAAIAGTLDLLLITVNVPLDWTAMLNTLKPDGRLHVVGGITSPMEIDAMNLIFGRKSVSGSPTASPAEMATMLAFAARHEIAPMVEEYPMSDVNAAVTRLREGKARYRIVLKADFPCDGS